MPADDMADQLGIVLPQRRDYQTVAGFVLAPLRHLPAAGEHVNVSGWRRGMVRRKIRDIECLRPAEGVA